MGIIYLLARHTSLLVRRSSSGWVLYISLFNLSISNALGLYLSMICISSSLLRTLALCAAQSVLAVALNRCLHGSVTFTKPFYWEKTLHGISKLAKANLQVPAQTGTRTTV